MFTWIDTALNKVTMYRLVLYVLLGLLGVAFVFCLFGVLPYNPFALLFSTLFITLICVISNVVSANIFRAPTNVESVYITALILALLITPIRQPLDSSFFSIAIWASIWAMASKYIFAIKNKHLFNPVALAVTITALALHQSASWWIGTSIMAPATLIGGLLIVRKIRRFDLVLAFFGTAFLAILGSGLMRHVNIAHLFTKTLTDTPILFFAFVMLTEPLTTPPTKTLRCCYGALVGALYAPWVHVGPLYSTPEIALVLGNVFSYLVSPKHKLVMHLKKQFAVAEKTSDFVFHPDRPIAYEPGQYMEWTLPDDDADTRGNRRYFTLASSPTEEDLRIGIKFYEPGSSFKQSLAHMTTNDVITASQLAGDFVMPKDPTKKLAFIAGGIGVTPFRSMIKFLVDRNQQRDVVLLYANKTRSDIAYVDVFTEAKKQLGIKTVYVLTDEKTTPKTVPGRVGMLDAKMIAEEIPDFLDRIFYISGPHGMVNAFETTLKKMGVPPGHIKVDFFPGFA